ncbi:superoxide dismutase [bacterium]|nr:superoxide dismutase [bacterium]|tara:strand:- start:10093 stop:10701 length:609 start_codon:yes stop_codon:yes gene_type:complete
MSHSLPELNYSYDALEPHIDAKTMEIHHTKHHQAYVNGLNAALEKEPNLANAGLGNLCQMVNNLPDSVKTAVRNHGGGHYNHSLFWSIMSPNGGGSPSGNLADLIDSSFGSFDKFKEEFANAAMTRFGSGWAWLVCKDGKLSITSTANQENPLMTGEGTPILGLDVWEHAYYLNYQNLRGGYIGAWWNVVDWNAVEERCKNC